MAANLSNGKHARAAPSLAVRIIRIVISLRGRRPLKQPCPKCGGLLVIANKREAQCTNCQETFLLEEIIPETVVINARAKAINMHFAPLPYLDPGSGSFLIQLLIAALLGHRRCRCALRGARSKAGLESSRSPKKKMTTKMTNQNQNSGQLSASFRDPSGFLFSRDGVLYRQVNRKYEQEYARLMESGLYEKLVKAGLLIPHVEVDQPPAESERGVQNHPAGTRAVHLLSV